MTSKSKGKFHQLNLNLYSKLKEQNSKNKSNLIENILQSTNLNQKNSKIGGNLSNNLNLNKNTNNTNINDNSPNGIILNYQNNSNNTNNLNGSSFKKADLIAKKYKTSKNSRICFLDLIINCLFVEIILYLKK